MQDSHIICEAVGRRLFRRYSMDTATPYVAMEGLLQRHASAQRVGKASPTARKGIRTHSNSTLAQMLSSSSKARHATIYRTFLAALIVFSVLLFIVETLPQLRVYSSTFFVLDGIISTFFLVDYSLRLYAAYGHYRLRPLGPIMSRLRWLVTWESVFDAASTFPFFYDLLDGERTLISFAWVRVFRVFLLFRTSATARAVNTCVRVLVVNRQILAVSLALVVFMLLVTSSLLFVAADEQFMEENDFYSIPGAMFLAVMMLTGQGTPEGDLTAGMRIVVVLTAILSVPFFAVPAAMLTWGFEGEAQRLATHERRRRMRREIYGQHLSAVISSSSSEGEDLQEYLEGLGGGADDERATLERRALDFFSTPNNAPAAAAAASPLLPKAAQLAAELGEARAQAARVRQQKEDALLLVESAEEELSAADAKHLELKLQRFARAIASDGGARKQAHAEQQSSDALRQDVEALRHEVALLRRTLVSGLSELRDRKGV